MSNDLTPPNLTPPPSEPPEAPAAEVEKSSRGAATTFGIINLVYVIFSIGPMLLYLFMEKLMNMFKNSQNAEILDQAIEVQRQVMEVPKVKYYTYISMSLGVVLIIILITAAVMLLRHKVMGRTLSLFWAVSSIGLTLVGLAYQLLVISKVQREFAAGTPMEGQGGAGSTIFFMVCCSIYPILVLIFMLPEKFKRSLDE